MPLYEYTCNKCNEDFMLLQPADIKSGETVCPSCGTTRIQKRFSTFASKMTGSADSSGGGRSCPPSGCGCS